MDDLLSQYTSLAKQHDLPDMQLTSLSVQSDVFTSADAVWDKIQQFNPTQGWLMFQSDVLLFSDASQLIEKGIVLNAELVGNQMSSLHVRQTASGDWCVTTMMEVGDTHYLAETRSVFSTEGLPNPAKLAYKIYWQDAGNEMLPTYFRFVGVISGENNAN